MAERVHVDRIGETFAVLLLGPEGREQLVVPARLLPPGTREGAALDLTLSPAPDDPARAEARALMEELFPEP